MLDLANIWHDLMTFDRKGQESVDHHQQEQKVRKGFKMFMLVTNFLKVDYLNCCIENQEDLSP
jgi:hypothetical protein